MDSTAFGWLWPGILSHAHTRLDVLQVQYNIVYIVVYCSINSLYYSIYLSEFCSVFRRNMGRPRKKKPLTNAERKRRW